MEGTDGSENTAFKKKKNTENKILLKFYYLWGCTSKSSTIF